MSPSVTVSIAAESTGVVSSTFRDTFVVRSASSGSTRLSIGRSNTSSKVSASGIRSFSVNGPAESFAMLPVPGRSAKALCVRPRT